MSQGFTSPPQANFAVRIDEAESGITYIGMAAPGSDSSAAVWQIRRINESGTGGIELIIKWADGNKQYDNSWDSRTGYEYS